MLGVTFALKGRCSFSTMGLSDMYSSLGGSVHRLLWQRILVRRHFGKGSVMVTSESSLDG